MAVWSDAGAVRGSHATIASPKPPCGATSLAAEGDSRAIKQRWDGMRSLSVATAISLRLADEYRTRSRCRPGMLLTNRKAADHTRLSFLRHVL